MNQIENSKAEMNQIENSKAEKIAKFLEVYALCMDEFNANFKLIESAVLKLRKQRAEMLRDIIETHKKQQLLIATSLTSKNRSVWKLERSSQFWEVDVQKLSDERFKNNFRASRLSFQLLCDTLKNMQRENTSFRKCIPLDKRIGIALYALGSSGEYRTIGNLFGVAKSTVCEILLEFCDVVYDALKGEYMNDFPLTRQTILEKIDGFAALGFPQCMGAIDGCHMQIRPRADDAVDYHNYKGWYSTILLALVDAKYNFMHIMVGAPGRCNDSALFEKSTLSKYIRECKLLTELKQNIGGVDIPVVILGDSAFKFSSNLMKPYPYCLTNNEQQKTFNYNLSRSRRVVENAFGHLKARFRRIGKGIDNNISNANKIIKACCVLHNFFNAHKDEVLRQWLECHNGSNQEASNEDQGITLGVSSFPAEEIRRALATYFGKF